MIARFKIREVKGTFKPKYYQVFERRGVPIFSPWLWVDTYSTWDEAYAKMKELSLKRKYERTEFHTYKYDMDGELT